MTRQRKLAVAVLILLAMVSGSACGSPSPGGSTASQVLAVTMAEVCRHDGQTVEIEGQIDLSAGLDCSSGDKASCSITIVDPFRKIDHQIEVPIHPGTDDPPANTMARLPNPHTRTDFQISTADGRTAVDRSFVSVTGTVDTTYGGSECKLTNLRTVRELDRLAYVGVDFTRTTLYDAITDGVVVASVTGDGLTRVDLKVKPNVEVNLEVAIPAGTMFLSKTRGIQNMVSRQGEVLYLPPAVEASLELEAACANMELKQPASDNTFTVGSEPSRGDLATLLAFERFPTYPVELQQAMIWTITDNPTSGGAFVFIEVNGQPFFPGEDDITVMRAAFKDAGIDVSRYSIFST